MLRKGFTLIEMIIIIVIIGILAAVFIPKLQGTQSRARDTQRKVDINTIANALLIYKEENGKYISSFINHQYLLQDPYSCGSDDKCGHLNIFNINRTYEWADLPLSSIPTDPLPSNMIYPLTVMDFGWFDGLFNSEQSYIQGKYWYVRDEWYDNSEIVFLIAHVENLSNANFWHSLMSSLIEFKDFMNWWGRDYEEARVYYEPRISSDNSILCKKVVHNINPSYPLWRGDRSYLQNCNILAPNQSSAQESEYYVRILR